MTSPDKIIRLKPARPCVICHKARAVEKFYPFCSLRCANIDLNRWLSGAYVIPGQDAHEDENDAAPSSLRDGESR